VLMRRPSRYLPRDIRGGLVTLIRFTAKYLLLLVRPAGAVTVELSGQQVLAVEPVVYQSTVCLWVTDTRRRNHIARWQ
jgi:hypothetical protein